MKGCCNKCGVLLTADSSSLSYILSGYGKCRPCNAAYQKEWNDRNRDHVRKNQRISYFKNAEARRASKRKTSRTIRGRYNHLRSRLKVDGVSDSDLLWRFNFYKELVADNRCHYCEGPLNKAGHSLDRMDNNKLHVCYNVVPCCAFCNDRKGSVFSYNEMMLLAPALREIRRRRESVDKSLSSL